MPPNISLDGPDSVPSLRFAFHTHSPHGDTLSVWIRSHISVWAQPKSENMVTETYKRTVFYVRSWPDTSGTDGSHWAFSHLMWKIIFTQKVIGSWFCLAHSKDQLCLASAMSRDAVHSTSLTHPQSLLPTPVNDKTIPLSFVTVAEDGNNVSTVLLEGVRFSGSVVPGQPCWNHSAVRRIT